MRAYKEPSWFLYSNFLSMLREISRYLLFHLFVSAILVCGSSRRIPRASCPSCSQDCPEALTVRVPWDSYRESDLQSRALSDFPINPLQNSAHSRLTQRGISQDIVYDDDVLPNQNSMSFENYKSFPQEEHGNSFFKNLFNKTPKFLDRREIISRDKSTSGYPPVLPSRQIFDRSENVFFRDPRNKYSESSAKDWNFQNYKKGVEDPMSKLHVVYRADRDVESSREDSKDTSSSNVILPQRSFPNDENTFRFRREYILDEERNAIKKSPSSVSQQHELAYSREKYNPTRFGLSEVKRDSHILPLKDLNIWKSLKAGGFFDNWNNAKDSSQSSSLEQIKQAENNFFKVHSAEEQDTIITNGDNGQIDYDSYMLSPDFNIWEPRKAGESIDNWNFAASKNTKESAEIKRLQEAEFNRMRMYPLMVKNTKHFENKEDEDNDYFVDDEYINQEYFEDEIEKDTVKNERDNYNPHAPSQNMDIWRTIQDEELFDYLDFTRRNSEGVQKTGQLKIYSEGNKLSQDDENKDMILEDKAHTNARAPVINAYNAYILPRYLNILNDAKYPAESSQISTKAKNNILHANPVEVRNEKFFEDNATAQDNTHIQDLILSKDIFDMEEYSDPAINTQNIRDNTQNQDLTVFDPDLLDDVEGPPMEPTESTPTEFSVPQQQ